METRGKLAIRGALLGGVVAVAGIWSMPASAKPGTLAQSPLFLGTQVKSNILFVLDDSGSMDWEVLQSDGARSAYSGLPNSGELDITPTRGDQAEMLESCAGYNVLYYNPNVNYTPWPGVDENGDPYGDQDITSARTNPYDADSTVDLTDDEGYGDPPGYMTWTDSDGDGEFDQGECPDPNAAGYDYNNQFTATASGYSVNNVMSASEQTNFANWFTYYRKREYVMKRAISDLMTNSTNRMGFTTLHDNNDVATPVDDMDAGSNPTHRERLLENLFENYSSGGTPLRRELEEAGEYYSEVDGYDHNHMSSASSPIVPESEGGACQQNFSILLSDGYWNGYTPNRADNADGDDNSAWDGGAMADSHSDTLADVAMYYYENDLSNLDDAVPTVSGVDENEAQHMTTFTVAFGINGSITSDPPNRTDPFTWSNPLDAEDEHRIDDMRHAAFNGRGDFLNAQDPQGLISSLNAAVAEIEARTASASSVSFNSAELNQDTVIYRASFNSNRWSGDLEALPLDPNTGAVQSSANWSASDELANQGARTVLTYDGSQGVPFTWSEINDGSNPITPALNDLKSDNSGGTVSDAEAEARLDYLRGDRSNEGSGYDFRVRDSELGDIVHSSPIYVGEPSSAWPDEAPFPTSEPYSDYKNGTAASRQGMVYIGSNDGMLHGFNADTGQEEIAFVPSALFSDGTDQGLHYLTNEDYQHRYYVDQTPAKGDIYANLPGGDGTKDWRTVVVGALGAGGRGVFALDVTDPSAFNESNASNLALWEFTSADDADMGRSFAKPVIARMNNGKWAAIFGNGYNNNGDGEAKLFILFIEDGLDGWASSDYVEITTGVGTPSTRNGLSSPALADTDGNGTVDRIYAGDLDGNMWAFDVSDSDKGNWAVAHQDSGNPAPLFTAAADQPITGKPSIFEHPTKEDTGSNAPNAMIYFGTGQYLTNGDKTTTHQQSLYGVWDKGESSLTRSDLQEQTIDSSVSTGTVVTGNSVNYNGSQRGWYLDLPESGERVVTNPKIRGENVFFTSLVPQSSPCKPGTTGFLTVLDLDSGGRPSGPAFDANDDNVVNADDKAVDNNGNKKVQSRLKDFGTGTADATLHDDYIYSDEGEATKAPSQAKNTGRQSWQELK